MAIEVKVPKDIKEYKEKIMFGMTIKQLITLLIAIGVNIALAFLFITVYGLEMNSISWVMILVSLPILSFGWVRRNELSFFAFLQILLKYHSDPNRLEKQDDV
ncbi:PrgI family protein [Vagococcus entomophilus]|uniref:PrgI family protein n=1 Tax=Vagococcus entomophilus TaxID=1160095 RepID=A0A430AG59_9ENTE|nr:PrgI family protein [Vagococcus entomophilus]RSU06899.1 hypothetical protein CBF30_06465 [Vagococcus entomophilus]